ncbi:hypothetical protein fh0823_19630 [Francisella halioticida]|uniref:hypothetical protein n=1 Tax=Francisella halioticida TaxID=549298 RepID=UPI001AF8F1A4|nr:hypothetical protein [Francisella halioticida]BCD91824.1 hypothetical protein fh0823_19630 [Francisella halioticida]
MVSAQAGVTDLLEKLLNSGASNYREIILKLHDIVDPLVDYVGSVDCYINSLFNELDVLCQMLYQSRSKNLKLHAPILAFGERVSAYVFNQILKKNNID